MAVNTKRVFYVKYVAHQSFIDTLSPRHDVRLDKLENDSPDAVAAPVLEAAHVYQIGSTRDELAAQFHATAALIKRAEPAHRLDQRRRLRHRQCQGLHRSRRAGVEPSRRESRSGSRACAGDDAHALQAHRRS